MKTLARLLALVLVFQIFAPTPSVLAAVTEIPLTVTVGAPRSNPLTNTIDVQVTVKNDLGYAVPGPIAIGSFGDPFPPVQPAPGVFQPYLVGKYGPLYPDGASAPYPSYVDLHKGLAPGESASEVLRFFNRDDVFAELDDVRTYVYPANPYGIVPGPTSFPTTGGPIDITTGAPVDTPGALPNDMRSWRTVGWVLQLFQYDFDATNFNGGTLTYRIVPIPSLPPSLAGAAFPPVINIDGDGVVRWWSTTPGLFAFRIEVNDGVVPGWGGQNIVIEVLDPATQMAADPLSCMSGSYVLPLGQQYVDAQYDVIRPTDSWIVGRAHVMLAEGRQMSCFPPKAYPTGKGTNSFSCRTTDGLFPADTCGFDIAVTEASPPPVPDPPDLRVEVYGAEKFQNCHNVAPPGSPFPDLVCDRYLEPTVTDRGQFRVTVSNDGDQTAEDVVVQFAVPSDDDGDLIDDEAWAMIPGREGTCTLDIVGSVQCEFGDLGPGERFDVELVFQPGNEEALTSQVNVWTSSTESDPLSNNQAALVVVEKAGPIEIAVPPPPKQQCQFREEVASISLGVIWESFRCIGEEMPWVTWFVSGVFAALSIATAGGGIILASQTALGGALRASWVFHVHEVITLAR
jgi:hypothetical protein